MNTDKNVQIKRQKFIKHFETCLMRLEKELQWASVNDYPLYVINDINSRMDEVVHDIRELENGTRDTVWGLSD